MDYLPLSLFILLVTNINVVRTEVACSSLTATDTEQNVYSHNNYRSTNYTNDYYICWKISTTEPNDYFIKLSATHFELQNPTISNCTNNFYSTCECQNDLLIISDSNDANPPYMHKCGLEEFTIYSFYNVMKIEFKTDDTLTYAGFNLTYSQINITNVNYTGVYWQYPDLGSDSPDFLQIIRVLLIICGVVLGVIVLVVVVVVVIVIICTCCIQRKGASERGQVHYTANGTAPKAVLTTQPTAASYNHKSEQQAAETL